MANFITNFFKKRKTIKELRKKQNEFENKEISDKIRKEIQNPSTIFDENNIVLKSLYQKAKELQLSENIVTKKMQELFKDHMQHFLNLRNEDQMIDDKEYEEILNEAKRLSINLTITDIEKYREYYRIASGQINSIEVNINLAKKESCFFTTKVEWYEYRKVTKRINYGGISGRVKIAKGISFRYGSIVPNRVSIDEINKIDEGIVYFTNKKIIFIGDYGNKTILLNNILDIVEYSDGLGVQRSSGKSPILIFKGDIHKANLILSKLLSNSK